LPLGLIAKFVFSRVFAKMKLFGKAQDVSEVEQH